MKRSLIRFVAVPGVLLIAVLAIREFKDTRSPLPVPNRVTGEISVRSGVPDAGKPPEWGLLSDPAVPLEIRLRQARTIRQELSEAQVAELFGFMIFRPEAADRESFYVVVNEVMEQMRKQGTGAKHYSVRLIALVRGAEVDPVVRDYAVQHLCQWIAPAVPGVSPAEEDESVRRAAIGAVVVSIRDPLLRDTTVPGTAIMALTDVIPRLTPDLADRTTVELEPYLAEILRNRQASSQTRAAALQMAARLGKSGLLPEIRDLAKADGVEAAVRLSAIHALGELRSLEDADFLRLLASTDNPFLPAARAALLRMSGISPR